MVRPLLHGKADIGGSGSRRDTALALVGLGRWGANYVREIADAPGVTLTAAASRRRASAGVLPAGIPWHAGWRELLARDDLDGLIISTPPATHGEIARAAIARDLPVLIEKPVTLDSAEAAALGDAAARAGAVVHVNHIDLWNPAWRALRRRLGEIGPVRRIDGAWHRQGPFRADTPGRWDWGAHAAAAALDVGGPSPRLREARRVPVARGDLVQVELEWDSGIAGTLVFGNGAATAARRMRVAGERGWLEYAAGGLVENGAPVAFRDRQSPLRAAILRFAACIRRRGEDASADLALAAGVVAFLELVDHALAAAD